MSTEKTVVVSLRVTPALRRALAQAAKRQGTSVNALVNAAVHGKDPGLRLPRKTSHR